MRDEVTTNDSTITVAIAKNQTHIGNEIRTNDHAVTVVYAEETPH